MNKQILKLFSSSICLYIASSLFSAFEVNGFYQLLSFGLVLTILGLLLRPLLLLITLPLNLLTIGLFSIVNNTILVILTDKLIKGVKIPGFWLSLLLAVCISWTYRILKQAFPKYARN